MFWLALGVVLWSVVHFVPSLALGLKSRLVERLGKGGYRAAFSVVVVISVALMVLGWRSTEPEVVYIPPVWAPSVAGILMVLGFLLFGAAKYRTVIKRYVRHPQLTGVVVWAFAHLLANGDDRSLLLFGGLGLWALVEMPLINAREGEWVKPEAPSLGVEVRGAAISLAILVVAVLLHPYFAGVSPAP